MTNHLALIRAIDRLYEAVVFDPGAWNDQTLADWADEVAHAETGKEERRQIRRSLRHAAKLRSFWATTPAGVGDDEWQARVDRAIGGPAWRPTLELAMIGLREHPSEELYELAKQRYRVANSEWWMDGVTYAEWLDQAAGPAGS